MFDYDDTEAAHLSEMYDDYEEPFTPYTQSERADYVRAKSKCFRKSEIGKYVIVQSSRRNKCVVPFMYLVDRNISKQMWWSPSAYLAMIFNTRDAAKYQAKKYRFNKVHVKEITKDMAQRVQFEIEYKN